jgi:hypothetical protein
LAEDFLEQISMPHDETWFSTKGLVDKCLLFVPEERKVIDELFVAQILSSIIEGGPGETLQSNANEKKSGLQVEL